jgi:electron transfer flavoprotein alpha subunit
MSCVYVIADQYAGSISDHTFAVIEAARSMAMPIVLLVAGEVSTATIARFQTQADLVKIVHFVHPSLNEAMPEWVAPVFCHTIQSHPGYVLMAANTYGKNLLPRLSALLDLEMISHVRDIALPSVSHDIYAGNIIERITLGEVPVCMSIQTSAFTASAAKQTGDVALEIIEDYPGKMPDYQARVIQMSTCDSAKPRLDNATCVLAGGRALGSAANFSRLGAVADKLGAAMGGTRAAVDSGYIENHYQIGQTGQVIAPETYLAFGISGAIQHVAGITASRTIIAVNTDPDAEIFQVADYGLVGDWLETIIALEQQIGK